MNIIPVIDLLHGEVVHAQYGNRSNYRAVSSCLAQSSNPDRIIDAFLDLYPFKTFYIADLDAIQGIGDHASTIDSLCNQYSDKEFWVDCGISDSDTLKLQAIHDYRLIIGTETLTHGMPANPGRDCHDCREFILSLDFKQNRLQGPAGLERSKDQWPLNVIIMSLDRVGANQGPDIERLRYYRNLAPQRNWYCAGGIRDLNDLRQLRAEGASGVLVSSCLHSGSIGRDQLQDFMS